MIARDARGGRSGITLTEILIAIMIMGVGLISLATLFPLGLIRMREATRFGRTGLLFESAADDIDARKLLLKPSFYYTWYGPRDPFIQDALADATFVDNTGAATAVNPVNTGLTSGLPFAYDPLWWALSGKVPKNVRAGSTLANPLINNGATFATDNIVEARFGAAVFGTTRFNINADPDGGVPSAHGLQRLTNFVPFAPAAGTFVPFWSFTYNTSAGSGSLDVAIDTFTSVDDIVFNPITGRGNADSPLLPEQPIGTAGPSPMMNDLRYSWFFTGRQVDFMNGTQFTGDVVVCDSRPFSYDRVTINGATANMPAGETTVEAIFGFGKNFGGSTATADFALGADRAVLLRWPVGMPDPQVRPGGWIADVTYERTPSTYATRRDNTKIAVNGVGGTPFVRCHWYQVSRRTEAETETANSDGPSSPGTYRRMVLTLSSNVRSKTLLYTSGDDKSKPVNLNFALVMPSVISVFPRAFEVH